MPSKDAIFSVLMTIALGVASWTWSLHASVEARIADVEKASAILEVNKANKSEIVAIKEQLARQTIIMEQQVKISERHAILLDEITRISGGLHHDR